MEEVKEEENKSSSPGSAKDAAAPSPARGGGVKGARAISRANFGSGSKT